MTKPTDPAGAARGPSATRRTLFAGAGAAGALAAAAALLPAQKKVAEVAAAAGKDAAKDAGYQLTDHVKQYYSTARV